MKSAPKPNTSACFGVAFGFVSTDFGAAAGLTEVGTGAGLAGAADCGAAAFTAGLAGAFGAAADLVAALAGAAAAFFGAALAVAALVAVVFFGAEEAADLLVAADLLFVLTVLAFSVLVDGTGAVDFAAGVLFAAGRTAPVVATGDFSEDFAVFGAGEDAGTLVTGWDFTGAAALPTASSDRPDCALLVLGALDGFAFAGASSLTGSGSALAGAVELSGVFTEGTSDVAAGTSLAATASFSSAPDTFWAAASISEDVITLRLAGALATEDAVDLGDALETGFVAVFPDVFFLESAIASTS